MLAVKVIPAAINFLEPAIFVKTMTFAVNLEAGNKLNTAGVVVRATRSRRPYTEPQPALAFIKTHPAGSCFGMPGGQQVWLIAKDKAAIA